MGKLLRLFILIGSIAAFAITPIEQAHAQSRCVAIAVGLLSTLSVPTSKLDVLRRSLAIPPTAEPRYDQRTQLKPKFSNSSGSELKERDAEMKKALDALATQPLTEDLQTCMQNIELLRQEIKTELAQRIVENLPDELSPNRRGQLIRDEVAKEQREEAARQQRAEAEKQRLQDEQNRRNDEARDAEIQRQFEEQRKRQEKMMKDMADLQKQRQEESQRQEAARQAEMKARQEANQRQSDALNKRLQDQLMRQLQQSPSARGGGGRTRYRHRVLDGSNDVETISGLQSYCASLVVESPLITITHLQNRTR